MGEVVEVPLSGGREYKIHIGAGMLASAGEIIQGVARSKRIVIVTQPKIAQSYSAPLISSLTATGFETPEVITFPAGERYKNLRTLEKLYDALYELKPAIDRKTLVIALGGGVVGDVVGYLAASYLRGLDYVQIPTTLLAMVDSSVGGKTGIDFRAGKNLVGAFHQPRAVIVDTDTLKTLPVRETRAGLAEIIKYGVIRDPVVMRKVSNALYAVRRGEPETTDFLIRRSCEIKAEVVVADEFETSGLRATLNFGHTIGHAVEAATDYRRYKHGEAVAIGMISAACIGEKLGITEPGVRDHIRLACANAGLPLNLPEDISDDTLLGLLGRDKKSEGGVAKFVIARVMGEVITGVTVDEATIRAGLTMQRTKYKTGS